MKQLFISLFAGFFLMFATANAQSDEFKTFDGKWQESTTKTNIKTGDPKQAASDTVIVDLKLESEQNISILSGTNQIGLKGHPENWALNDNLFVWGQGDFVFQLQGEKLAVTGANEDSTVNADNPLSAVVFTRYGKTNLEESDYKWITSIELTNPEDTKNVKSFVNALKTGKCLAFTYEKCFPTDSVACKGTQEKQGKDGYNFIFKKRIDGLWIDENNKKNYGFFYEDPRQTPPQYRIFISGEK